MEKLMKKVVKKVISFLTAPRLSYLDIAIIGILSEIIFPIIFSIMAEMITIFCNVVGR